VVEYVLHVIVRLYVLNVELSLELCVIAVVLRRPHEHNVPRDAVPVQPLSGLVIRVRPVEVDVLSRGHEDDLRAVAVLQNLHQVPDAVGWSVESCQLHRVRVGTFVCPDSECPVNVTNDGEWLTHRLPRACRASPASVRDTVGSPSP